MKKIDNHNSKIYKQRSGNSRVVALSRVRPTASDENKDETESSTVIATAAKAR
jgi:hypothetical protein